MGVTQEASKVTDPTSHTQWPSRMRVGLIKCEKGEKGCRGREIQTPDHSFACKKKGGQETFCTGLGQHTYIQVFSLIT